MHAVCKAENAGRIGRSQQQRAQAPRLCSPESKHTQPCRKHGNVQRAPLCIGEKQQAVCLRGPVCPQQGKPVGRAEAGVRVALRCGEIFFKQAGQKPRNPKKRQATYKRRHKGGSPCARRAAQCGQALWAVPGICQHAYGQHRPQN